MVYLETMPLSPKHLRFLSRFRLYKSLRSSWWLFAAYNGWIQKGRNICRYCKKNLWWSAKKILQMTNSFALIIPKDQFSLVSLTKVAFSQGLKNYVHAREWVCTCRAPKSSIRYTKKRAPKINSDVYVLQNCYK